MATLDLFSKAELESLDDFLRSPYFVSKQNPKELYPLFQYIHRYLADKEHPNLEKAKVYQSLYPKESFIKGRIDKLMSALLQKIHQFIILHFNENIGPKTQEEITLVDFFRKRNAPKQAHFYLEKAKKKQAKIKVTGENFFFNEFLINKENIRTQLPQFGSTKPNNLQRVLQPLDAYYLLNKLEYACFLLSFDRFRQPIETKQITLFLDKAKVLYEAQGLLESPLLAIYYQTYEMLKKVGETDTTYWELKELIIKNQGTLPLEFLKVISGLIRNVMLRRLNHGAEHLREEIFHLYQKHLEKGYLHHEEGLLPSTFKNIVAMGLKSKAFDWVFQFLQKNKEKIRGTKFPEDVYHYNLAYYYFEQQQYDQALELLVGQYDDLFYKISAKRMELKIYYETKSQILISKIDAFKVYIFRLPSKKILDHKRASNNNYIKFLHQLSNSKTAIDPKRIERLLLKVEASQFLTEKDWLLQKLQELKK